MKGPGSSTARTRSIKPSAADARLPPVAVCSRKRRHINPLGSCASCGLVDLTNAVPTSVGRHVESAVRPGQRGLLPAGELTLKRSCRPSLCLCFGRGARARDWITSCAYLMAMACPCRRCRLFVCNMQCRSAIFFFLKSKTSIASQICYRHVPIVILLHKLDITSCMMCKWPVAEPRWGHRGLWPPLASVNF